MKQKLWLTLVGCVAYCIDKELYKAIDYLREQVCVLVEHQEKQDKRIILTDSQRMRIAAKAKRLSRKMLEQCTELVFGRYGRKSFGLTLHLLSENVVFFDIDWESTPFHVERSCPSGRCLKNRPKMQYV